MSCSSSPRRQRLNIIIIHTYEFYKQAAPGELAAVAKNSRNTMLYSKNPYQITFTHYSTANLYPQVESKFKP